MGNLSIVDVNRSLIGNIEDFFKENSFAIKKYHSGEHNLSVDGSGTTVSVTKNNAEKIANYIKNKFSCIDKLTVLDVGTGVGCLVCALNNIGITGWGLEGSIYPISKCVCSKNQIILMDLTKKILDTRLHKSVHLTTSFEVFEHIHRAHEDIFLENLAYLSDYHFCSINMNGWPGVENTHCNIKHLCCWLELFRKYNIECIITDGEFSNVISPRFSKNVGIPVKFNKYSHNSEKIGLPWNYSMFCVLDMRKFNRGSHDS